MAKPFQRFRRLLAELKRRNVYRVAVAYLAVAFVGLQAARLLVPPTTLPAWADDLLIYLAVFGFPIALVLAWAFELTADGMRRTPEPEPSTGEEHPHRGGVRAGYRVLVGLGLLAAAVAGGWYLTGGGGGQSPEVSQETVAVLPFQTSGEADSAWRDGMMTMLNMRLDGAAGLRAIPDRTVLARWEERGREAGSSTSREGLAVARGLGAGYAVDGSAVQLGEDLRLIGTVQATPSGDQVGRVSVRGSPNSVSMLADSLARRLIGVLAEETGEPLRSARLASETTTSVKALKIYLEGRRHVRHGDLDAAIADYQAATEVDSSFALPHAGIALSGLWGHRSQRPSIRRAYELSGQLPIREHRLVRALYLGRIERRTLAAADSLRRLTRDYPDDPSMWNSLGEFVAHEWIPRGIPEVEEAHERGVALDPGHTAYYDHYVTTAFTLHHDSALAAERIAAMPDGAWKDALGTAHALIFGRGDARERAMTRLARRDRPEGWGPALFSAFGPGDLDLLDTVLRTRRDRFEVEAAEIDLALLANELRRGHLRHLWSELRDPDIRSESFAPILAFGMPLGMPVPDSLARRYLARDRLPSDRTVDHLLSHGLYLIEEGRTEQLETARSRIRAQVDTTGPTPVSAGRVAATIRELRGYRAFREERLEEAARLADRSNEAGPTGAIWRGDLYRDLGRLERAEGWYLAAWGFPVAHQRLGRLYEEMGRPEEAAVEYRRFVEAWEDADPALQPRVEAARERIEQLTASASTGDD